LLPINWTGIGAASMACWTAGGGNVGNGMRAVGSARSGLPKGSRGLV
jgi:hypothetical protein